MTTPHDRELPQLPEDVRAKLDLYLDGQMSAEDRVAFETLIASNPQLSREVGAAHRTEAQLQVLFAVPADVSCQLALDEPLAIGSVSQARQRWLFVALAATLALVGSIWLVQFAQRVQETSPLAEIYRMHAEIDFAPMEVCTTPEAFGDWTQEKLGTRLVATFLPSTITLVGWSYTSEYGGYTPVLIARDGDAGILITMDKPGVQPSSSKQHLNNLHVFEREVGGVRMCEISPLTTSRVIEHIAVVP